jgi:hypothetical protein
MRKPNCGTTPPDEPQNWHSGLEVNRLMLMEDGNLPEKCIIFRIPRSGGMCASGVNASSPLQRGLQHHRWILELQFLPQLRTIDFGGYT